MPTPFKAVLFDHDGTLVDSEHIHFQLWNQVLEPYHVQLSVEQFIAHYTGVPALTNGADLVQRFGLPLSAAALAQRKYEVTQAYLQTAAYPLMPGVREAMAQLKAQGLRFAMVTAARRVAAEATVRAHGLAAEFATVVTADDVTNSKPDPECYRLALQRMGLLPQEAVAFEDTAHGMAAALGAGLACVAIPTPMSASHDFSRATVVLPNMLAAAEWVVS